MFYFPSEMNEKKIVVLFTCMISLVRRVVEGPKTMIPFPSHRLLMARISLYLTEINHVCYLC